MCYYDKKQIILSVLMITNSSSQKASNQEQCSQFRGCFLRLYLLFYIRIVGYNASNDKSIIPSGSLCGR
jgi:hypothetical protein